MTKPKETRYPTQAEQDEGRAHTFWDPITAEVGAKAILKCRECAVQCPTMQDLVTHAKAVHPVMKH